MTRAESQKIFLKKCVVVLLVFTATFPCQTLCNSSPSFKYSREANTHFQGYVNEKHEHGDGVGAPVREGHGQASFHAHREHCSGKGVHQSNIKEIWLYSVGSTLFISVVPFFFLFIIPLDNSDEMKPRLKIILAFASGGLLGDAFLHLIPHASGSQQCQHPENSYSSPHSHNHDHSKDTAIGLWVLGGIITFLSVEKLVRLLKNGDKFSHGHSHGNITKPLKKIKPSGDKTNENAIKNTKDKIIPKSIAISGYLNLAADFAHNFTDGLAIGASYLAGNSIGVVTTLTILLHEVPHEIGDFAILIKSGCSPRKAMVLQLLTALGALSGNCLALLGVGVNDSETPWVLPFTAGGFIYIATVSVLPELLEDSTKLGQSIKEICALLTGVIFMILIANFE